MALQHADVPALLSAIYSIWPDLQAESLVKRAAAIYLLQQPGFLQKGVVVASHVTETVGKVKELGIEQGFEKLLDSDPCFTVDKSLTNSLVTLNTSQVLLQHQWRQDEQEQQQQHWQLPDDQVSDGQDAAAPAAAHGPLHVRATPRLLQRLNEYWPLQGPKATSHGIVKHKALYHLLQAPEHSCLRSSLAHAVKAALGKPIKEVGCTVSLTQVLMEEPNIFVLGPGPAVSEATITLNVPGMLDTFVRWRYHQTPHSTGQHGTAQEGTSAAQAGPPLLPLQQQQQPAPAFDAVAEPGVVSAAQLLQYVCSRQWHSDPLLDEARRALAKKLVLKVNSALIGDNQPANTDIKRYSMLGALAGHTIAKALENAEPGLSARAPSLEQAVDQDPYLSLHLVGSVYHIRMDVGQLLQDAAAAAHASTALQHQGPAVARGASSSSSTGREGASLVGAALSYDTANGQAAAADYAALPVQAHSGTAAGGSVDSGGSTAPAQQVSSAALLGYVQRRCWHKSDPRLDLARRTVAVFIVEQANSVVDDRPARSSAKAYTQTFVQAGIRVNKALKARFGNDMKPCYKKFADIFEGDPCWSTFPSGFTQSCVQLQVQYLLQEMTGTQHSTAHIAGSSSSRGVTSQTGGQCMSEAVRPGSAASASTTSSRKQAAGASPATSSAAAGSSGAGAAEAAAAAIQAAAKSLMPPLVRSSKAPSPAAAAAAAADATVAVAADVDVHPGSYSTTTAAAAASGELLPVSPAAAESAQQEPFLPPWLQLCKAGTSSTDQQAATSTLQQQQQQQAVGSSAGQAGLTAGHLDQAALQQATRQEQQQEPVQGSADVQVQPVSSAAVGSAARMTQADDTPLQYQLQFDNTIPGWYMAKYVPYDTASGSPAAAAAAGADAAAMQDSAAGSAGPDTAAESDSCSSSAALEAAAAGAMPTASPGTTAGEGLPAVAAAEAEAEAAADEGVDAADMLSDAASAAGESAAAGEQPAPAAAEGAIEHGVPSTCKDTVQEAAAPAGSEADAVSPEQADTGAAAAAVDAAAAGGVNGVDAAAEQGLLNPELLGLLQALPDKLHPDLLPYLSRPPGRAPHLSRILISRGQPVTLRFSNRTALTLTTHITLSEAVQQLLAAQQQWSAIQQQQQQEGLQQADMTEHHAGSEAEADLAKQGLSSSNEGAGADGNSSSTMNGAGSGLHDQHGDHSSTSGSRTAAPAAAAAADHSTLQRAAVRLFSSHSSGCVGIPFSCHRVCAVYDASGAISGLTYCIDTQPPGSAQGLADLLSSMKASLLVQEQQGQQEDGWTGMDRPHSLLLLGRPGVGKASLLRDICRLMSGPPDAGGLGLDVMLIDRLGHVAGVAAEPCSAIGSTRILSSVRPQQPQLMVHAALQHQPDVLVVAELSTQQDVAAAVYIARNSNVLLVAAAPAAASLKVLLADATLCPLVGCERTVTRDGSSSSFSIQSNIQAVRPSPFAVALELISSNRWCLHADLPATISSLLAEGAASSSASGSRIRLSQQPYPHSQLRSQDARGGLQETFKEAAAVHRAVAEAALVKAIAQHGAAISSE